MATHTTSVLGSALCLTLLGGCHRAESPSVRNDAAPERTPAILLNGERMAVRWSDGDTFSFTSGPHRKAKVRLLGFNTLESYGPVHRWGEWLAKELYEIATSSQTIGESRVWSCKKDGGKDGYGRLLVSCPDAALELVGQGHAHVMALDDTPRPALLEAQRAAQKARRGIWAKGIPPVVVTSVHSADEKDGKDGGYNRVVDTQTGQSTVREHNTNYEACQEVCEGPAETPSCMVYVPYEKRYRDRPPCLVGP